ncbi:DNA-binding transcriptional regulator, AcrR family [Ferrimonas sediminum]|uniref:DNA-binding transcriptional regulator, AcrR family n=1 Tax=Ferrimonas sediminum TaxID=718193 RepID=A0A1G8NPU9_9GAMM|nr:TetR/AcrR family transcriptional regulator [Ferrimonas sediminum]SDI82172.1 DNA-binding transcriptional regulator, AcrR family [Ferrimonas sediminum]
MQCPHSDVQIERCHRLLDSTESLIEKQGLISFKLSQVSKESELSNSTFYKLFESKEDLLVCCFLRNATSNHFSEFERLYPELTSVEKVLIPIIFSFEATYFSPTFNLVRQTAVNSMIWRLASPEKVKVFEQRINQYWLANNDYLALAVKQGDLIATQDEVREHAQAITFFLSGCLSSFESRLIDRQFLHEKRQTLFRQLQRVFLPYEWKEELSLAKFERMGMRVHMYYQANRDSFNSCRNCLAMQKEGA